MRWQAEEAEWVHLVDLDAAYGRGSNAVLLTAVIDALDVKVELAGGVRDDASLAWAMSTRCGRAVLAADALTEPDWSGGVVATHGDRIAVGLDVSVEIDPRGARRHRLTPRGSGKDVGDLWEALEHLDAAGCSRYVLTDVSTDGRLTGPNLELCREVSAATGAAVVASGGVASLEDLRSLATLGGDGTNLDGVILGTALYAGRFTLADAIAAVRPLR